MRTDGPGFVVRRQRVRGVFNHCNIMLPCNCQHGIHLARMAIEMDGKNCFHPATGCLLPAQLF